MRRGYMVLLLVSLMCTPAMLHAQSDDEAWIERYMDQRSGVAAPVWRGPGTGDRIEVDDLPRFVGYSVRLGLSNGRSRHGVIESADERRVVLIAQMSGGRASLTLSRAQIVSAQLE
jgi:hypothetical protein